MNKEDRKELEKKLETTIAGEKIGWDDFERYLQKSKPLTLSTLMKAVRVESYLDATNQRVDKRVWIILGVVLGVAMIVGLIWYLFFQPEQTIPLVNGTIP